MKEKTPAFDEEDRGEDDDDDDESEMEMEMKKEEKERDGEVREERRHLYTPPCRRSVERRDIGKSSSRLVVTSGAQR